MLFAVHQFIRQASNDRSCTMCGRVDDSTIKVTPHTKFSSPQGAFRNVNAVSFSSLNFDGSKVIWVTCDSHGEIMPVSAGGVFVTHNAPEFHEVIQNTSNKSFTP